MKLQCPECSTEFEIDEIEKNVLFKSVTGTDKFHLILECPECRYSCFTSLSLKEDFINLLF